MPSTNEQVAEKFREIGMTQDYMINPPHRPAIKHTFTEAMVPGDLGARSTIVGWPSGIYTIYLRSDFKNFEEYANSILQGVMDSANEYLTKR